MKVSIPVYIHARPQTEYDPPSGTLKPSLLFFAWPYENYDGAEFVCTASMEVDVPATLSVDGVRLAVLRREQARVQAEFTARITAIQSQINNLLAIEG